MDISNLSFPHQNYKTTLTKFVNYFKEYPGVYAIVLTGSLARGRAVKGSCIDLFVFLPKKHLKFLASTINSRIEAYSRLGGQIAYYEGEVEGGVEFGDVRVDVGFTDGSFNYKHKNSFDITRDDFETTVGNLLVYSIPLYQKGKRFQWLKRKYLPFYNDALRRIRLKGTAEEFDYKTWKTKWLAERGEYFAALDALLEAQRIFLQHLFIKERKYPIDYVKWLHEQFSEILSMPELYRELTQIVDRIELTKNGIFEKSNLLEKLFKRYGFYGKSSSTK
ncbi:MAG TPA: nucleotidyltransferase domain-containing protein [Candidatus Bathyarchaeia archaeon]|nr:nucleotidyltransferase domain-containing protein [Candidatus Bathyarchaeia archaeon]